MKVRKKKRSPVVSEEEPKAKKPKQVRIRDPIAAVKDVELQREILQHRMRGESVGAIAERLGIDRNTASKHLMRALEDYRGDYRQQYQQFVAEHNARYDAVYKVWMPKALGGRYLNPTTGEITEIKPDLRAANFIARLLRNHALLSGGLNTVRVEHMTVPDTVSAAVIDEQETARLIRLNFGEAASKSLAPSNATTNPNAPPNNRAPQPMVIDVDSDLEREVG